MMHLRTLAFALAGATLPLTGLVACTHDASSENEAVGTLKMPLTAVSTSGAVYQLRNANLRITGTESLTILSEEHLTETRVEQDLRAGAYLIRLQGDWSLEQVIDGVPVPVEAVLVSPNPQSFSVVDQEILNVNFVFAVGDDVIELGNGRVSVGILVDDGPPEGGTPEDMDATCNDGVDNDDNGLTDCEEPTCAAFCEQGGVDPGTLLWEHEEPSLPAFQQGLFDESSVFGVARAGVHALQNGMLTSITPVGGSGSFTLGTAFDGSTLALATVGSGSVQVDVLEMSNPGAPTLLTQTTFGGAQWLHSVTPGPQPDAFVIATSSGASSDTTLTSLNRDGLMLYQTFLGRPSTTVLGENTPEGQFFVSENDTDIAVFSVDPTGLVTFMDSVGRPANAEVLEMDQATTGELHVYVTHPTTGNLARYHFDPNGSPLAGGLTFGPYASPAVQVAASDEAVAIVHSDQTLELTDIDGVTQFSVPLGTDFVRDVFFAGDQVCVAGTRGAAYIACYQR